MSEINENKEFKCLYCDKTFKSEAGMKQHITLKHSGVAKTKAVESATIKVNINSIDNTLLEFFEGRKYTEMVLEPKDKVVIFEAYTQMYIVTLNVACKTQMRLAYQKLFRYTERLKSKLNKTKD